MAASPSSSPSPTARAASAVELAARCSTPGSVRSRYAWHWAVATGMDTTALTSLRSVPGRAISTCSTSSTTSRWIRRSWLKASASCANRTVPSMAFSIGTKPTSTTPASTARSTCGMVARSTSSAEARSAWLRRACSVNVPGGPRKPTRTPGGRAGTGWQDSEVDAEALRALLDDVAAGRIAASDAARQLERLPFADLGYARIDHHRALRQGLPEAVYGPGKTPEACAGIVTELLTNGTGPVLLTRANDEQAGAALAANPGGTIDGATVTWRPAARERPERIVIAAAGTADLGVADECAVVLAAYGFRPARLTDVGVAGLHRILPHVDALAEADAVVVVAGMEGALASVVGGLTSAPVVAVPTSAGYGASLGGVTALLAMLASCAAGVTVVGIDNGFGAACAVARACDQRARRA